MATIQPYNKFIDTYWLFPLHSNKPYSKVSLTRQDRHIFNSMFKDSCLIVKRLNFDDIINMSDSLDCRRKVLAIKKEKGLSMRETAKHVCIGSATVLRWIKQIEPKPPASRSRKSDKSALEKEVRQYPDAYQRERAIRFGVCQKAIWQALKKWSMTYKKTFSHPKADENLRKSCRQQVKTDQAQEKPLVFIDDSGFSDDLPRNHGDSPKGQRCYGGQDWLAKGRTNAIGALRGTT